MSLPKDVGIVNCVVPAKRSRIEEVDWRLGASNFQSLFRHMYKNNILTDLVIKVGSGSGEIECHSVILMGQSPVFESMLNERWANDARGNEKDNRKRAISLPADDPKMFTVFLDLIYRDWNPQQFINYDVPNAVTPQIAVGVFQLAHKYLSYHVLRRSEYYIESLLYRNNISNTATLYALLKSLPICTVEKRARQILRTVENWVLGDASNIFASQAILVFSQSDLSHLVQQQELRCDEKIVYTGCLKWAVEQCLSKQLNPTGANVRTVLGEIVNLIRFPLLDNITVTDEVIPSAILTQEEITDLVTYKLNKNCLHLKDKELKFPVLERTDPSKFLLKRLDVDDVSKVMIDYSVPHGFEFTSSEYANISSVWFYGGDGSKLTYKVTFYKVLAPAAVFATTGISPAKPGYALINEKTYESTDKGTVQVKIEPVMQVAKNAPIFITFTVTGGKSYCAEEDIATETKKLLLLNKHVTIFKFKRTSANFGKIVVLDGLKQIPHIEFSA